MKKWLVYRHTSPSGKIYIGITSNAPNIRWHNGTGYKHCVLFNRAIEKYGWDNIKHEVLFDSLSEDKAKSLEIELIRHYKNLGISYNITNGGDGSLGRITSEETKAKQRAAKLGKPLSEEHIAKIRANAQKLKGVPRSAEVKQKLHEKNKGKKPSPQTIEALKKYLASHPVSQEVIKKLHDANKKYGYKQQIEALNRKREQIGIKHRKPVVQFSLQGEYINTYDGAKFASIETGTDPGTIAACCKGRVRQSKGYLWMYEKDYKEHIEAGTLETILKSMVERVNRKTERSAAWREVRSKALKGKDRRSAETKKYMDLRAAEANSKPVLQLTLDGKPVAAYYNGKAASKAMNISQGSISLCCNNKIRTSCGYTWKYITKDEYEKYKDQFVA